MRVRVDRVDLVDLVVEERGSMWLRSVPRWVLGSDEEPAGGGFCCRVRPVGGRLGFCLCVIWLSAGDCQMTRKRLAGRGSRKIFEKVGEFPSL